MLRMSSKKKSIVFLDNIKHLNLFKVVLILFLVGLIYGAVLVASSNENVVEQLSVLTQQFINKRAEQSVVYTFFGSLGSSLLILLCLFICGFCAVSQPVSFFVPLFHGLGLGVSAAYLYAQRGWQGLLFCLVLIIPTAAISTFAMLLASRESVRFSNRMFRQLFPQYWESEISGTLRLYLIRFGILLVMEIGAALLDSVCTFLFAGLF